MIESVHNPDQYMYDFKQILTNGRKKIGLLVGAGAPVSINTGGENWKPLIPDISGLTKQVLEGMTHEQREVFTHLENDIANSNLELVLSRIRALAEAIGTAEVYGLDSQGYHSLSADICTEIKKIVDQKLPSGETPFSNTVAWINGINRSHAVEIFTTNYDLLLEQAMENVRTPYFDGFSGSKDAFFDPSTISSNDLPPRWVRLWKLHGSINWSRSQTGEIIRGVGKDEGTMVYPSHIKYDQTQSAPFSSLFDRLKNFLLEPDSLLITTGFSFADAHISAKLDECLSENGSAAVIAFQFNALEQEKFATEIALRRPNISVYCKDGAVINGVSGKWRLGDLPSKHWELLRNEYWDNGNFILGDFLLLGRFLAQSGGGRSKAEVEKTVNDQDNSELEGQDNAE